MHGDFEPLKLLNKKTTAEFLEKERWFWKSCNTTAKCCELQGNDKILKKSDIEGKAESQNRNTETSWIS